MSRPATPLSILLLVALLVVGACDVGFTATPAPTPRPTTASPPTLCPGTTADPNATPWNGGTAAPGSATSAPCPSLASGGPGATTAAASPGASTEPSDAGPSASAEPTPTPDPSTTFIVHVVVAGDNLTSIARRYDTHPRSIAFWNRDAYPSLDPDSPTYRPNHLEVGWKLRLIPGVTLTDPLPTRRPSALPSVSIPPPPSVAPGEPAAIISNGPRGTGHVALTFDMGGELGPALDIIGFLIDNDVRATIFPTGQAASEEEVGIEVLELVASKPDLFLVANHSYDHPNFTELTPEAMLDQLERTEQVIVDATGRTSKPFFRPPFGAQNAAVRQGVADAGWPYIVMWDIDTIDWKPTADGGPTVDDIVAKVLTRAQGGSIVLMHLGGFHTLEALPRILAGLADKGLEPVTLSEMLGL
jgi:peptidoglycan/xylan/chitin deacetylase (PgdA/CDA1 family)